MRRIVCCFLLVFWSLAIGADENKDHGNYSPDLSKRDKSDTESSKDYVGYSNESNFNNFDREKSNTYKMSVSPPSGGTFIPDSECSGEIVKDKNDAVEGKKLYAKNSIPTSAYIIAMNGQVGFSGEGGSPNTWGAYVRNKYYYLTGTNATYNGATAESIGLADDSSFKFTANEMAGAVNSKWTITKTGSSGSHTIDDVSSITFDETLWDTLRRKGWDEDGINSGAVPGVYNISAVYKKDRKLDTSRTASGKLTVIGVKYIRLLEPGRNGNQTARAVNPDDRSRKKYENNVRSDIDLSDNSPMFRIPTNPSDNKAKIKFEIEVVPSSEKNKVKWIVGSETGSLDTNTVELAPKTSEHQAKTADYDFEIGVDLDSNGKIEQSEKIDLKIGLNIIGTAEYNKAISNSHKLDIEFGNILYPIGNLYAKAFRDGTHITDSLYSEINVAYTNDTYNQKNGFGCRMASVNSGSIRKYEIPANHTIPRKIFTDPFILRTLENIISSMQIDQWYQNNPNATEKEFSGSYSQSGVSFVDPDLNFAYGGMTTNVSINLKTEKIAGSIIITEMSTTGYIYDLYDWKSDSADTFYGMSLLQTTYNPSYNRNSGWIYESKASLDKKKTGMSAPNNRREIVEEFIL